MISFEALYDRIDNLKIENKALKSQLALYQDLVDIYKQVFIGLQYDKPISKSRRQSKINHK